MTIRKFVRDQLESEPHDVLFKDLYPWDAIDDTPFGASLAVVQPGGRTMLHSHDPAETFVICRGRGTMRIDGTAAEVAPGDVIYLRPQCVHDLRNDSETDDLVFVSVFWDSAAPPRALDPAPRLLVPSPPTPNGPLHLGHLAGPYLVADVVRRYHRARGTPATVVCLFDEHQSYVLDRARREGAEPGDVAQRFAAAITTTLARLDAAPDVVISPSRDAAYRAAVRERLGRLLEAGALEVRDVETLHCDRCALALYDSFVAGACPHCGAAALGFLCEACFFPNDPAALVGARCDLCGERAARRTERRLVFPIAPHAERLAEFHRALDLGPKLRRLAAQWLARAAPVPASQASAWGIALELEGLEGQVISPWFEIALAGGALEQRAAPGSRVHQFFGYDNAYLYLVQDPAVAVALDPEARLPVALIANEFLLLDDAKMSTSGGHTLDAAAVLDVVPADLLRLYLAKIRPEDGPTSASLASARLYLMLTTQLWGGWLARLGACLAAETGAVAPAATNPSLVPWSAEQTAFLGRLRQLADRARRAYDEASLREVSGVLHELVERAASFGAMQAHLAGVPSLAAQRATGLAIELAAARALARLVAPLMPSFAAQLWAALGEPGALAWSDTVEPVPAGQRIALAGCAFFAAPVGL